ncbi:hypothetical protein AGABI2DRAFT_191036, partial [Agaricus bisporus var. bisporus H97]|uniref:hypothetical protein n=1 Tax=Agaricus bisporus var. bisporus (strain H97 / ATCC MYA-4626 / FGSC 10389) TaxID=936046 RepID=UPI00029F6F13
MSQLESFPNVHSSEADVWYLKDILFGPPDAPKQPFKIITQNYNGPCSLIAICNILILRGDIEILPPSRQTVSYEFLSQLVAEYLLTSAHDIDVSAALTTLPYTQKGIDLNPVFTDAVSFRPSGSNPGDGVGELDLFRKAGIELVHGWLVDPESEESEVVSRYGDYDRAVELVAEVDHLTGGRLVLEDQEAGVSDEAGGSGSGSGGSGAGGNLSEAQRKKVEDAIAVQRYLGNTSSQLTYHGLFYLAQTLKPYTLYALFRNSHLSVIYKTEEPREEGSVETETNTRTETQTRTETEGATTEDIPIPTPLTPPSTTRTRGAALYALVTDEVFLQEPSIVWERLADVDGSSSSWTGSDFRQAMPPGGDFAGQTAEDALIAAQIAAGMNDPTDHELALQLQAEEEENARRSHERRVRQDEQQRQRQQYEVVQQRRAESEKVVKKKKKKSDCVIM